MQRVAEAGQPVAHFRVTDGKASVEVAYVGILPDLFREGQGVVTLGTMRPDGTFRASEVLAKHDETYMPKDVADALKKAGMWDPSKGPPPPAATWNTLAPPRQGSARMSPELGHFALALACALAFAQAILPLWGAYQRDARLIAAAPGLACGQLLALGTAAAAWCGPRVGRFLRAERRREQQQPEAAALQDHRHLGEPRGVDHPVGADPGAVRRRGGRVRPHPAGALRARVIGVLGGSSAGFLLFSLLTSNPFTRLWPAPMDGRDMNPLLQDPGLAFHPPMLYAGYVGFAVPFAFAVAALLEGRVDASWGRWVRPWTLVSWCLLTCGIALGSWWAYYELGWGGFWFWDPVENASLLPWLTGTALLHSAIVVEKREALKIWTVLLAIGTFSLSPVRHVPGALRHPELGARLRQRPGAGRVHPGPARPGDRRQPAAVRAARAALAAGGLFAPVSREGALVLNNVLLCSIAAVVLTGTMYPLFSRPDLRRQDSASARRSSTRRCCRWRSPCSSPWRSAPCCRGSGPPWRRRCCGCGGRRRSPPSSGCAR